MQRLNEIDARGDAGAHRAVMPVVVDDVEALDAQCVHGAPDTAADVVSPAGEKGAETMLLPAGTPKADIAVQGAREVTVSLDARRAHSAKQLDFMARSDEAIAKQHRVLACTSRRRHRNVLGDQEDAHHETPCAQRTRRSSHAFAFALKTNSQP